MIAKLNNKGVTLVEMIIVIAIMAITLGTAYTMMGGQSARAQLKSDARDLAGYMKLARTGAIRDGRAWAIKFDTSNRRYMIYRDSGESVGSEDWDDGDETIYRTVNLATGVDFGSAQDKRPGASTLPDDGVSFLPDRVDFNRNGTSMSGTVYLSIGSGETFAVGSLSTTGRVKVWSNYGSGWSD